MTTDKVYAIPERDPARARVFAETLTRVYEEKVLGHPIRGFADGANALKYMLGTEHGKQLMREAMESAAFPPDAA